MNLRDIFEDAIKKRGGKIIQRGDVIVDLDNQQFGCNNYGFANICENDFFQAAQETIVAWTKLNTN